MSTHRAMALGAHPDDVEIYCLGLLLRLQAVGWEIGWAVATDGQAGLPPGATAETRRQEALRAGALVNVKPDLLGRMDANFSGSREDVRAVRDAIRRFSPNVIITHNPNDYHPDHRTLARVVAEACPPDTLLLFSDSMLGDRFLPDLCVDVTTVHEIKRQALAAHRSQAAPQFMPALDTWSAFRALHSGVRGARFGEAYKVVETVATRKVHRVLIQALSL